MPHARLTPQRLREFACPPGRSQAFLWDSASSLALRVTAKGAKAFIFQARLNGQTIRCTIGDAGAWDLDKARAAANELQTLIDKGIDPRALARDESERKAAEKAAHEAANAAAVLAAQARQRYTLRKLCEAYTGHLEARGKSKGAADAKSAFLCHVFPQDVADKPAKEITALDVAKLVRTVAESGKARTAGILRSYLNAAFTAARKAPLSAELPAELIAFGVEHNPVEIVPTIAKTARDRVLSVDELQAYLEQLGESLPDRALRLALLAGGQRMAQLLRARLADWDVHTSTLRLFDGKGRRATPREHHLPLGPLASALVIDLAARAAKADPEGQGARYLFGVAGGGRMTHETPGKRLAAICKAMKVAAFDLRDVRRTVETQMAALGIGKDLRAQLLSHGLSGVQAMHYDRHDYVTEKRAALAAWENRLEKIKHGKLEAPRAGNVIELPRKRATTRSRRG